MLEGIEGCHFRPVVSRTRRVHQRCTTPTLVIPAKAGTQASNPPHPPPLTSPLQGEVRWGSNQTRVWGIAVVQIRRTVFARPKQTQRVSAKIWGIEQPRIYGAAGRVILPRMTRHKTAQTGLGTPQPRQLWLTAVLRALAMLVLHVASTLQMIRRRTCVNATRTAPAVLPRAKTDTHQETNAAQQSSPTTPSVSHAPRAIHLPQRYALMEANRAPMHATKGNLPPPVRSTGGGGLRALARKTEGVRATQTAISASVNLVHAFPAKAGTQSSSEESVRSTRLLDPRLRGERESKDRATA
jgi:hypothetical protein